MKKRTLYLLLFLIFNVAVLPAQDMVDATGHEDWEFALEYSGDVLQIALPLTAGLTTVISKDWQGTKQFLLSYATTMVTTYSLKKLIHKQRPEGRHLFDAFPSGHTSSAFSGASFIQRRYGWKYGKWAYLLAAVVGVSRMEGPNGFHDIWDVVGGAAIAIGSTYIFTKPKQKSELKINFSSNKNNYVIGVVVTF